MSDQISDAVFTTEQVLDDDEPVRVPETFEDGRQTGEVTEFDIGFIDSINCHMAISTYPRAGFYRNYRSRS